MNAIDRIPDGNRHARCTEATERAARFAAPARRACRVQMTGTEFTGLVAGWSGGLFVVLLISALIRHVG